MAQARARVLCVDRVFASHASASARGFSLILDQDERAHRDEPGQVVDVGVLQRDAAPRPVDAAGVQTRLVRPVDADRAARADVAVAPAREIAPLHREPVAMEVLRVGVVEQEKPLPAWVRALVDDHVEAGRRAAVPFVELAARAVETEDGRKAPDASAVAVHVERAACLAHHHDPRLLLGPGELVVVVGERPRRYVHRRRAEVVERIAGGDRQHPSDHHHPSAESAAHTASPILCAIALRAARNAGRGCKAGSDVIAARPCRFPVRSARSSWPPAWASACAPGAPRCCTSSRAAPSSATCSPPWRRPTPTGRRWWSGTRRTPCAPPWPRQHLRGYGTSTSSSSRSSAGPATRWRAPRRPSPTSRATSSSSTATCRSSAPPRSAPCSTPTAPRARI